MRRGWRIWAIWSAAVGVPAMCGVGTPMARAQGAPAAVAGPMQVSASVRVRAESWDWFGAGDPGEYTYGQALARVSVAQARGPWQWRVEAAVPALLGLPDDAIASGAAGQLGLGATLYAANDRQRSVVRAFVKQAHVRWAGHGQALRLGRFEFADGGERAAADPTLSAIKAQRIGQRLIGPFGFSAVGRSFDGLHYTVSRDVSTLTLAMMRPTAGAFRVDGQPGLPVDLGYAAFGRGARTARGERDLRVFAVWYADHRSTVPTDNRPAAQRSADRGDVRVMTMGGHWAAVRVAGRAKVDALAWGAWQGGTWGRLHHAANALALEAGLQHRALPWQTWIRAGMLRTSGDDNPADGTHRTFFQLLPTPRVYARMPFYNMMNSRELFVTAQAKPSAKLTVRVGAHDLRLTESADLWYVGGGAFDRRVFGFVGRPSGGATPLARVLDASIGWQPRPRLAVELYGASARGGAVVQSTYGASRDARFVYLETTLSR